MMEEIILRYRKKGVLIDANLLLLLGIGTLNQDYIPKFKRTNRYVVEDFLTLTSFLSLFTKVVTTPNILTEVSNLANSLTGNYRVQFGAILSQLIEVLEENYLASQSVANTYELYHFGLSDSTILKLVKEQYLLLTDDLKLSHYAMGNGIDVVNFNHIRIQNWE
jgi:rRNA-processing protein FCF1